MLVNLSVRTLLLAGMLAATASGQATPAPTAEADPWTEKDLLLPKQLAARLKESKAADGPSIVYVGFPVLYRGAHLPGAKLAGPGSKPTGLEDLKKLAAPLPRGRELVVYCGCCPWEKCPNVRPAYRQLREMGFTRVRIVVMPTNLHTDWVEPGYPVERGE